MEINKKKLLMIGEVYVDVHLDTIDKISRIGGIFHSARALHSTNIQYAMAVITPAYLKADIDKYSKLLGATQYSIIGTVVNCPNVMIINESTEARDQGYLDVLYCQAITSLDLDELDRLIEEFNPTDILIYPGKYNLLDILELLILKNKRIHIDFQYNSEYLVEFQNHISVDTIILSTSSKVFLDDSNGDSWTLVKLLDGKTKSVLLKENRGGSRFYLYSSQVWIEAPAFLSKTVHSVGVGDVFNVIFLMSDNDKQNALKLASYISSWYASTYSYDVFYNNMQTLPQISDFIPLLKGVRLKWEDRRAHHIYIAGPDFPNINTKSIDDIYESLIYHNFYPHRPVKENGLITGEEKESDQQLVYDKDIELLNKCSILIAVLINDDPGTYVEIGWMAHSGRPTILYDPSYLANNLFLEKTVSYICHSLTEVIDTVFKCLGSEK
ncbi:nucleoside 2-deoxyribosyltransferase [Caldifermentibacillus hisashii]|uniref:nucleoside 2-deoxyribosyltransferase n=1 Tax=Caldifermentibacillus hisashii TaxID=996558 RepID=UPI0034D6CC33